MATLQTTSRIATLPSSVAGISPSTTSIGALTASSPAPQRPAYALFDGIAGPESTSTFSGAFDVRYAYRYNVNASQTIGSRVYNVTIIATSAAPTFFNACVSGRLLPRVRLLLPVGSDQSRLITLNAVTISNFSSPNGFSGGPLTSFVLHPHFVSEQN